MLEVRDLHVSYGSHHAVRGATLTTLAGSVLGVVGPNGSGKSSLIRAIAGLQPSRGSVVLPSSGGSAARVGYMAQDTGSRATLTVLEVVLLGRLGQLGIRIGKADLDAVQSILDELDLAGLASRLLSELSGGQRQLVFLAQTLASAPTVLLLDEPISALDIRHQLAVLERIRDLTVSRGLFTVTILHDLNAAARYCDRIALMSMGGVAHFGTPREVLSRATIAEVFGVEAAVIDAPGHGILVSPIRTIDSRSSFASPAN